MVAARPVKVWAVAVAHSHGALEIQIQWTRHVQCRRFVFSALDAVMR